MSRTRHPRPRRNRRELHRSGGGYIPPGRFSKTLTHRRARREPVLTLADYQWPDFEELQELEERFWDWYDPNDFLDDRVFGPLEDDDFEPDEGFPCSCRECRPAPALDYLDDFDLEPTDCEL